MKRLLTIIKLRWMEMELERCKQAAAQVVQMERDVLHYRIKHSADLPESMRYTWSI